MTLDLLVIGASAAGWQGAISAAQMDRKVGLIRLRSEADSFATDLRQIPGGLLRDACADWPIMKGRKGEISPDQQTSWIQFAAYAKRIWLQEQAAYHDQFLEAGGKFWCGDAWLSGPQTVRLKTQRSRQVTVQADQILIATGTVAHLPGFSRTANVPPNQAAKLLETGSLACEACVIGASLTGLRAACLMALWGSRVRILDGRRDVPVFEDDSDDDGDSRAPFNWRNWAETLGVRFDWGEDVIGLKSQLRRGTDVILESGRVVKSDSVWIATGRRGRTADLQLETAGLTTDDCGRLWCDSDHMTWVPTIRAIGDVVGFPPMTVARRHLNSELCPATDFK